MLAIATCPQYRWIKDWTIRCSRVEVVAGREATFGERLIVESEGNERCVRPKVLEPFRIVPCSIPMLVTSVERGPEEGGGVRHRVHVGIAHPGQEEGAVVVLDLNSRLPESSLVADGHDAVVLHQHGVAVDPAGRPHRLADEEPSVAMSSQSIGDERFDDPLESVVDQAVAGEHKRCGWNRVDTDEIGDPTAGLSNDQDPRRLVPRSKTELPVCLVPSCRYPGQVESRRAESADPVDRGQDCTDDRAYSSA